MEQFKMKIKKRIVLFSTFAFFAVVLGIAQFLVVGNTDDGTMEEGTSTGFRIGIILAIGVLAIVQIIKLNGIVNDDKKLQILYNKEHDERLKAIRSKAGMPMLMINSILILIAAVVAGNFSHVVFITLVITAMIQLVIGASVKIYYLKTM